MEQLTVIGRLSKQELKDCIMGVASCDVDLRRKLLGWLEVVIQDDCDLIVSAPADNDPYKKVSKE